MTEARAMTRSEAIPQSGSLLLRGGTVIDGTGAPRYAADVRIRDGRIAEIGANFALDDDTVLDAMGRVHRYWISPIFKIASAILLVSTLHSRCDEI